MLVLDTETLAPGERAEAFQATVSANCSSSLASFEDPAALRAEMHVYELGPVKVFNIDASGTTLRRTPRHAREAGHCEITLALPMRTHNHLSRDREEQLFGPRDLVLADLSASYVYGWRGMGASYAVHVDFDDLGLPMETIRRATRRLRSSPIYPLVRDHVVQVTSEAHGLAGSVSAAHVGAATAGLMHALIVSAGDAREEAEAMNATLATRVQTYVRHHLRDPDLTPARIAKAHGLSLRALYKLYETIGVSLEQSIIEQRLRGARTDLAAPRPRHSSIAATARAWGFTNPSFFSSRFRAAYGVTPRQWQRGTRPGAA
jgi:AraC-like DNA-binding protein